MENNCDFEKALADLETLVQRMESNELTLAQAMAEFEHGISLLRHCQEHLDGARQQVSEWMASESSAEPVNEKSD